MKTEFRVTCVGGFTFAAFHNGEFNPAQAWREALKVHQTFMEFQCGETFMTVRTDAIIAIEEIVK